MSTNNTNTVRIDDETWEKVNTLKKQGDSFNDVIKKVTEHYHACDELDDLDKEGVEALITIITIYKNHFDLKQKVKDDKSVLNKLIKELEDEM